MKMKKVTMSMILIVLLAFGVSGFAQQTNLRINKKAGAPKYEISVSEISRIVFQDPSEGLISGPPDQPSNVELTVVKTVGLPVKKQVDDIKQLDFSNTAMTIVYFSGPDETFNFADIDKILLNEVVIISFTPKTNLRIVKGSTVNYEISVSEIEKVLFVNTVTGDALVVNKKDASVSTTETADIQQLEFSETDLKVVPNSGATALFSFDEIDKLFLINLSITIDSPKKVQSDIMVYLAAEGDAIVESTAAIQSLTVVSITGAVLTRKQFPNAGETSCRINMQSFPAGVYIVNVVTPEGITVKKLIKN